MVFRTVLNVIMLLAALIIFLGIWNAWGPGPLLVNTLIALLALKLVGWLGIKIEIGIWSLLIVLLGGIAGLLLLIFLSITGLAFRGK